MIVAHIADLHFGKSIHGFKHMLLKKYLKN